jgi:hypothetical protein
LCLEGEISEQMLDLKNHKDQHQSLHSTRHFRQILSHRLSRAQARLLASRYP